MGDDSLFAAVARAARGPSDIEALTRALLEALSRASGLDSVYLTVIHWGEAKQEILYARNSGPVQITEGLLVEWCDTLCRRALMGGPAVTSQVSTTYPDSGAAVDLGIETYVSVPVVLADAEVFGTLCGASAAEQPVDDDVIGLFEIFARLISADISRERQVASARDEAAAAERRFRQRTLELASVEHQLKTPLTVIAGWAQVLRADVRLSDDQHEELVSSMERQVGHLRSQIDALLMSARADLSPSPVLALRPIDLRPVVTTTVDAARRTAPYRQWSFHADDGLYVNADPAAMNQIVAHLLDNAVKYTERAASIDVSVSRQDDHVLITVGDDGPGLPVDIDSLFEPFTRSGPERDDSSGLGLYIVRALVDQHGGAITATNRPGGGAEFRIELRAL